MKKYLSEYIEYIEKRLENATDTELENIFNEHRDKIQFMQHERLIHFMVTMLFTIMLFICLGILSVTGKMSYLAMIIMILGLLVPYIMHYYFLENTVQKMYKIYDEIIIIQGKRAKK
ncbi:MAG: hypothetical protein LKG21_01375 [Ruminococcus sp.]|jgi:hypothetical protein|nr:hypothetical protein [Ruminococcus sp.]